MAFLGQSLTSPLTKTLTKHDPLPRLPTKDTNTMQLEQIPSPCYVCDLALLRKNAELLNYVQQQTGAEVICALKGYSLWSTFPLLSEYLAGTTASSLWEARLGAEEMGKHVHIYAPAFRDDEIDEILTLVDHISFNSFSQWARYRDKVLQHPRRPSPGLRINPEYGEVEVDLYNPCAPLSRLGVTRREFREDLLDGIEGLHFHALCEQGADVLERTLAAVEKQFGDLLGKMKWINFGGGHHITRKGYDVEHLIRIIRQFREKHGTRVILEPGEAVGWQTGVLVAQVLDILRNDIDIAILDISVSAHMPDCLEMPYRPMIRHSGEANELPHTYRLGGTTCLAGDVIGDYSFEKPLRIGDKLIFEDMIHYTMVKTTMFNGVKHPSIGLWTEDQTFQLVREFGYEDFKGRLS